jgi:hypothetical protein
MTETPEEPMFAVAKSCTPSPFKSAAVMSFGKAPG